MSTIELNTKNFSSTVEAQGIVLVDWWAAWCGPCRAFAPIFEKAAEKHADLVFAKIDTDAQQALARAFGIRSIPTLMAFRDGILVFAEPGMLPAAALEDLIRQVRALDMDEVRRKVAEQEQKEQPAAESGPTPK